MGSGMTAQALMHPPEKMPEYTYDRRFAALSGKLKELTEPLFRVHDEYLQKQIPQDIQELRERLRHEYPDIQAVQALLDVERNKVNIWPNARKEYDRKNPVPDAVRQWFKWFHDPKLIYGGSIQSRLDKLVEEYQRTNRMKLSSALEAKLGDLPLKSIDEVRSKISRQGIEGEYLITLEDGTTGKFSTRSIAAGGHTIQRYHFRYLMKLDPNLVHL